MFQPQYNRGWAVLYPVRRQRRVDACAEDDQWRRRICTNLIYLDDLREGDIIWWSITSRPKKLKLKHCLHSFDSVWSHYDSCKPCLINKVQNVTKREESFVMSCTWFYFFWIKRFRFDLFIIFSVSVYMFKERESRPLIKMVLWCHLYVWAPTSIIFPNYIMPHRHHEKTEICTILLPCKGVLGSHMWHGSDILSCQLKS